MQNSDDITICTPRPVLVCGDQAEIGVHSSYIMLCNWPITREQSLLCSELLCAVSLLHDFYISHGYFSSVAGPWSHHPIRVFGRPDVYNLKSETQTSIIWNWKHRHERRERIPWLWGRRFWNETERRYYGYRSRLPLYQCSFVKTTPDRTRLARSRAKNFGSKHRSVWNRHNLTKTKSARKNEKPRQVVRLAERLEITWCYTGTSGKFRSPPQQSAPVRWSRFADNHRAHAPSGREGHTVTRNHHWLVSDHLISVSSSDWSQRLA